MRDKTKNAFPISHTSVHLNVFVPWMLPLVICVKVRYIPYTIYIYIQFVYVSVCVYVQGMWAEEQQ